LLLGWSEVDYTAVDRADPESVLADVYITKDLTEVYPSDLPSLYAAYFLRYLYLGGRLFGGR
jgi:hypothetical protein